MSFKDAIQAARNAEMYVGNNEEYARRQLAKAVQELAKSIEGGLNDLDHQLRQIRQALSQRS